MSTRKKDALEMLESKYGRLTFAETIKAWRQADDYTQVQFAKKLKISVQSLCDLEKGRRIPTPARAAKLAKILGTSEMAWIALALRDSLYADGFALNVRLEKAS